MEPTPRSVTWEAPEHHHVEKGNDWFFAVLIIVVALVVVAILFNNILLALLLGIGGLVLLISSSKQPAIIPFGVTTRGVRINERLYPFTTLESYNIDEEDPRGPQLYLKSQKKVMPLIVIPLPPNHIEEVESILENKLVEEDLDEPLFVKVLELFGF